MTSITRRDTLALTAAAAAAGIVIPGLALAQAPAAAPAGPAQAPGFYRMRLGDLVVTRRAPTSRASCATCR